MNELIERLEAATDRFVIAEPYIIFAETPLEEAFLEAVRIAALRAHSTGMESPND